MMHVKVSKSVQQKGKRYCVPQNKDVYRPIGAFVETETTLDFKKPGSEKSLLRSPSGAPSCELYCRFAKVRVTNDKDAAGDRVREANDRAREANDRVTADDGIRAADESHSR